MSIKIEDTPVGVNPLLIEAVATLPKLKVGQSFVIPGALYNAVRHRAKGIAGKFSSKSQEDGSVRIGRVA